MKQEADRLLADYLQKRTAGISSRLDSVQNLLPRDESERVCGVDWDTVRPINQLRAEVEELECDLDRKLMLVYYENHLWNQFLDRYLHLLETEPQNSSVVLWQHCALTCSRSCGRTEEVGSRLEHLIRFHKDLKTARGIKSMLEELKLAESPATESASR